MKREMPDKTGKSDRALALHDKGLTPAQIAERLGSNPRSVSAMILHARQRREKAARVNV